MKNLFFLLFFLFPIAAHAQDTCVLSFETSQTAMGKEHESKLLNFLNYRNVESASVFGYFSGEDNASRNRIVTEERIKMVREILLNNNVPFNRLTAHILLVESRKKENTVEVVFRFSGTKGEKVLKKTAVVQISEVNPIPPRPALPVMKQEEKVKEKPVETEDEEFFSATAFKKDETIRIPNLLFEGGTHYFLAGSERVLKQLLRVMQENPKLRIELQGHICCRMGGMDGYDPGTGRENLSEMRARAVYLYLKEGGIDENRMTYRGFGSSRKLYEEDFTNAMAAQQNRRVEVLVISTD